MMHKSLAVVVVFLMILLAFLPIQNVKAFSTEVSEFNRIWYSQSNGFNKNSDGALVLALTYTNNSLRTVDHCSIEFHQSPFYFAISFTDIVELDDEGYSIDEPDGYLYLRKALVMNFFPDNLKELASKNLRYTTIQYDGDTWYRVHIPDFNHKYEWGTYDEPVLNEKWFTWGSNSSVRFNERAMFIEQIVDEVGSVVFDFSSSVSSGQMIIINKSFLEDKGIINPEFTLGKIDPSWQPIRYTEDDYYYYLYPQHFSIIGIHERSSGDTFGLMETYSSTDYATTTNSLTISDNPGVYGYPWSAYQSFIINDEMLTITHVKIYWGANPGGEYIHVGIADENNDYINGYAELTRPLPVGTPVWTTFNVPDVQIEPGVTYHVKYESYHPRSGSGIW